MINEWLIMLLVAIMLLGDFMKTIKKMLIFILSSYLVIGLLWIGKDVIIHYLNVDNLPVLGYHGVVEDHDKQTYFNNYAYYMAKSDFEAQMAYLAKNDYQTLTMAEVEAYYHGNYKLPKKAVALTFDDGLLNFKTIVKPILEKYNLKATCFVIGHKTEIKNNDQPHKHQYLRKSDLINDEFVEYYSHSYNLHHKRKATKLIETLSVSQINADFLANKDIVSSKYFAFPYGISSKNATTVLKKQNVALAFGYNQNRNMKPLDNQYLLPRYLMFSQMPLFYFKWIVE